MVKQTVKDITLIPMLSAVIVICSWITVPAPVPFTLQTFGVFFGAFFAGGRRGTIAVLLYIALGAIGLPVFSGFTGGIGHILSPTGGYILGFLVSSLTIWLSEFIGKRTPVRLLFAAAGLLLCYTFGTLWFMLTTESDNFIPSVSLCVLPYIIPDCIKISLAYLLAKRLAYIQKLISTY